MGTGMAAVLLRGDQSYEVVVGGGLSSYGYKMSGKRRERKSRGKMMKGSGQLRADFRLYVMVASLDDTADCI